MAGKTNRVEDRDRGWQKLKKNFKILDGVDVAAGIARKEGDESHEDSPITLAELAAIHEFGVPEGSGEKTPRRSFLRDTFDINRDKYGKLLEKATKEVVKKKKDPVDALFVLSQTMLTDIKERIKAHIPPELAESTLAASPGKDIPLVNTGQLVAGLTSKVQRKGTK